MESPTVEGRDALPLEARVQRDALERALFGRAPGIFCGRYRLVRQVDRDHLGSTFEAYDACHRRAVTVRTLRSPTACPETSRVVSDAVRVSRVRHPSVLLILDIGACGPYAFVVSEPARGQPLRAWLAAARPGPRTIAEAFAKVAAGLGALHRLGAVHGHFGPDSVVMTPGGAPKIVDCVHGAAALVAGYAAPEVLGGALADAKSDQFSLCATLFEALAGQLPFALSDPAQEPTDGHERHIHPKRLRLALARGLSPAPSRRFRSMRALTQAMRGRPAQKAAGLAAASIAVGLAAAGLAGFHDERSTQSRGLPASRSAQHQDLSSPSAPAEQSPHGSETPLSDRAEKRTASAREKRMPLRSPATSPPENAARLSPARFDCSAESAEDSGMSTELRDHVDALNGHAEAYAALGRHTDALDVAERVLDLLPDARQTYQYAIARFVRARALGFVEGRADAFEALRTLEGMSCRSARRSAQAVRVWLAGRGGILLSRPEQYAQP